MKIKFTKREQKGLHCRFCGANNPRNLFETSPIKGIVCESCRSHLKDYSDKIAKRRKVTVWTEYGKTSFFVDPKPRRRP
jgi:hypothetical protein